MNNLKRITSLLLIFTIIGSFFAVDKMSAEASSSDNLIVNGNFEDGLNSWSVEYTNDWSVSINSQAGNVLSEGSKSLQIRHFWSKTYQQFKAVENTNYEYEFYCKRTSGGATTTVSFIDADTTIIIKKVELSDSTTLKKYKGTFNSGTAKNIMLLIESNGGGGTTYTFFDGISVKISDDENIVKNDGFENGLEGWTVEKTNSWSVDINETVSNSGSKCLQLKHTWLKVFKKIEVEENTDYCLEFYSKRVSGGSTTSVGVYDSENKVLLNSLVLEESDSFVKNTLDFNSGSNSDIYIRIESNNGNSNTLTYLDDFSVVEGKISNLCLNGGFEDDFNNWKVEKSQDWIVSKETFYAHSGTSMHIRHFWSKTTQIISVEQNNDYEYSFFCKRVADGATSYIKFVNADNNETLEKVDLGESDSFKEYRGTFNSGDATRVIIWIESNGGGGNTHTYLDDISVKGNSSSSEQETTSDFINGDFENGFKGWTVEKTYDYSVSLNSETSNSGTSLQLKAWWLKVYQSFKVKNNTEYTYSFYCMYKSGNQTTFKFINNETSEVIKDVELSSSDKFEKYSGTFNTGGCVDLKILIESNGGTTNAFFDDITMEEFNGSTEDEENGIVFGGNLLINGGFEDGYLGWNVNKFNDWSADIVSNTHNGGNNSLQLKHTWLKITQEVNVNKNSDYELTFFSKRNGDGSTTEIRAVAADGKTVINKIFLDDSSNFTENTLMFNSGENTKIIIWIESNNGGGLTLSFLDDFCLSKAENNDELYFGKESLINQGSTDDSSFTVNFKDAVSKSNSDKIKYSIYCSKEAIDGENISELTPVIENVANNEKSGHKITGLEENNEYYIAVKAIDEKNNEAYLRSGTTFKTMSSEQMNNIVKAGTNIIKDGSFESGKFFDDTASDKSNDMYVWHNYGGINKDDGNYNASFNEEQAYSGIKCLRTYPWTFQVRQYVDVKTHTDYSLSYKAFSYQDGLNIKVYGVDTNGLISEIKANQTFDFQRYEGTFNSGDNTKLMICVTNDVSGCHIAFIDDIIMVEIENKDLYVAGDVVRRDYGDDYITVGWDKVNTTSDLKDITYNVYMSQSKIDDNSLSKLISVATLSGDSEDLVAEISGIVPQKEYWFAVCATDKSGNKLYMYSNGSLSIPIPEPDDEDEEDESDITDDMFDSDDSNDSEISEDDEYPEYEETYKTVKKTKKIAVNKPKYIRKLKKVYHLVGMSTATLVIIIASICVGVLTVAVGVFIILKKKGILRRRKNVEQN